MSTRSLLLRIAFRRPKEYANNKILRFEPAAGSGCVGFNPLEEIRLGTEHEVADAQNLALLIVDPDGKGLQDHWQKAAQPLLAGCILHLLYKAKVEKQPPPSLSNLDEALADPSRSIDDFWKEMLVYAHIKGKNGEYRTAGSKFRGTSYKRITACAANEPGEKESIRLTICRKKALQCSFTTSLWLKAS
jgi:type IV secretory pathway TraG/TraD family ATPase VirD4